jgi:hypothetical protein
MPTPHPIMSSDELQARTQGIRNKFTGCPPSGSGPRVRRHCARVAFVSSQSCIAKCMRAPASQPIAHGVRGYSVGQTYLESNAATVPGATNAGFVGAS